MSRKDAEEIILKGVYDCTFSDINVNFYKEKFAAMNDEQFSQFIDDLQNEKVFLSVVIPNFIKKKPTLEQVMQVGKNYGHEYFEQLYVEGSGDLPTYLTPEKFMILRVPFRRASQLLSKKISVPPHTKVRDIVTGQVTGESKGATVSGPEVQILAAMGAHASATEMMKYRGGDIRGGSALTALLSKFGRANQGVVEQFSSGVQSTFALRTFLTCAMHRTNL